MEATQPLPPPKLAQVPDAVKGAGPLFEAAFLPYVGLMLGGLGAGAVATYNALMVRRFSAALWAVVIGGCAFCLSALVLKYVDLGDSIYMWILVARAVGIASGFILMRTQKWLVLGHEHLEGETLSLGTSVGAVFFLSFLLPSSITFFALGLVAI